ncbi:MAG: histidine--tRNA ligase, partial [Pseudomonadota bacterium]
MSNTIPPIKGMKDLLPAEAGYWHRLEDAMKRVFASYDYRELRTPIVEHTELFKRGVGEVTDIVEKEMYSFDDRNGANLSLRPENTASCVRAGISNGLLHNQRHRFWYYGPMFRHENPQKGRYRQFYQFGAEAFGFEGPTVDAELIAMARDLWRGLELPGLSLEINSIGTSDSRAVHREKLIGYFSKYETSLDADSKRRLGSNPLRILDSKNPDLQELIEGAPRLADYLDQESIDHFDHFKHLLDGLNITYKENHRLVRGLDYYTRTVFEWVTTDLGAQSAVCAGGRYDGLVQQLGGKPMPAVGWSMGVERIVELMKIYELAPAPEG